MKIILYKRCASICARIDHLLINPEIVHLHEVAFAGPRGILNSDRSTAWERPSILPAGRISRTRQICILSLYCLSYMYKFSFDSIHLSAVRARAINKSNHLSHSNFSRDGLQVSFCTFVLFTLWRVNFFLLSKLLPKLPIRLYFYTHKISNIIYILQFILHGL